MWRSEIKDIGRGKVNERLDIISKYQKYSSNNYNDNYKDRCLTDVYNHSLFLLDG